MLGNDTGRGKAARERTPAAESPTWADGPTPPDYVTLDDLDGRTADEIRRRHPWAVELVALDGRPCYSAEDLL